MLQFSEKTACRSCSAGQDIGFGLQNEGREVERFELSLEDGPIHENRIRLSVHRDHDGSAGAMELLEDLAGLFFDRKPI